MKPTIRSLLVVASAAAAALTGSAQLLNSAASSASALRPTLPPAMPPPSASATSAVSSAATSAASMRAPLGATVNATVSGATHGAASATVSRDPALSATAQTAVAGEANGVGLAHAASHDVNVALNTTETLHAIQASTHAARRELSTQVEARLTASKETLAHLKDRADAAGDRARADFGRALRLVRSKEKELRSSLKAAVKAKGETTWGEVQSALARDYAAYAEAMAAAEATIQGSVAVNPKSDAPKS